MPKINVLVEEDRMDTEESWLSGTLEEFEITFDLSILTNTGSQHRRSTNISTQAVNKYINTGSQQIYQHRQSTNISTQAANKYT